MVCSLDGGSFAFKAQRTIPLCFEHPRRSWTLSNFGLAAVPSDRRYLSMCRFTNTSRTAALPSHSEPNPKERLRVTERGALTSAYFTCRMRLFYLMVHMNRPPTNKDSDNENREQRHHGCVSWGPLERSGKHKSFLVRPGRPHIAQTTNGNAVSMAGLPHTVPRTHSSAARLGMRLFYAIVKRGGRCATHPRGGPGGLGGANPTQTVLLFYSTGIGSGLVISANRTRM
jgi:hypothetical protein